MSLPDHNPFQAPIQAAAIDESPADVSSLDFVTIAKKWERYRLIYNGILILETLVLTVLLFGVTPPIDLCVLAVFGAFAVNFFFLLGPALDGYCQWLFKSRNQVFGLIILVLGTLFSVLLAAATVIGSIGMTGPGF